MLQITGGWDLPELGVGICPSWGLVGICPAGPATHGARTLAAGHIPDPAGAHPQW